MSPQITWRNIDAPDFSQSGRLLEAGTRNVGDAFTGLQNLIGQQQEIGQANFENARKRNTAELQNQLLGFKTPEEMAAAQAQFTPEALRARFGAAYDQSAINQLAAERPGQLRQDLTSQIQLGNLQQAEASEPYEQQFYALLAQNPKQAAQFLEQNKASFADTQKMYGDLANKQNQLDEMAFRRAQLAEQAAGRAELRAERQANKQAILDEKLEKKKVNDLARQYTTYRLNNPDANPIPYLVKLQSDSGVSFEALNSVIPGAEQTIQLAGKPTPAQELAMTTQTTKAQTAADKFEKDALTELKVAYDRGKVDTKVWETQKDTTTTLDNVYTQLGNQLSDKNEIIESVAIIQEEYPNASPATIGHIIQKSLNPSKWGGLADGATVSFGDVRENAKRARVTSTDTASQQAFDEAKSNILADKDKRLTETLAGIQSYGKSLAGKNIRGEEDKGLNVGTPDYSADTKKYKELFSELYKRIETPEETKMYNSRGTYN